MWFILNILILYVIIRAIISSKHKSTNPVTDKYWYLRFALSGEDAISQLFILLSYLFLSLTVSSLLKTYTHNITVYEISALVVVLLGFALSYVTKTVYVLPFSIVGLVSWWCYKAFTWINGKDISSYSIFLGAFILGLLFYIVGRLHDKYPRYKRFGMVYLLLSIFFITSSVFTFSTKMGLVGLQNLTEGKSVTSIWQVILSLGVFYLAFWVSLYFAVKAKCISIYEALGIVVILSLFTVHLILPPQHSFTTSSPWYSYNDTFTSEGVLWAVLYNIAIFLELLGLLFTGYIRREPWLINLGAFFLFLLIIAKYSDWLFTFLDKSVFFIGAGVLMFGLGWFMEKGRKYMVASINRQN